MAYATRTTGTVSPGRPAPRTRPITPDNAEVGGGWDRLDDGHTATFRIYVINPANRSERVTVHMNETEAMKIAQFLAATLGFELVKPGPAGEG